MDPDQIREDIKKPQTILELEQAIEGLQKDEETFKDIINKNADTLKQRDETISLQTVQLDRLKNRSLDDVINASINRRIDDRLSDISDDIQDALDYSDIAYRIVNDGDLDLDQIISDTLQDLLRGATVSIDV
jgi:hypothetical protein